MSRSRRWTKWLRFSFYFIELPSWRSS